MEKFTYRMATLDDLPLIIETMTRKMREERDWKEKDLLDTIESEKKNVLYRMKEEVLLICLAYSDDIFVGMGGIDDWDRCCAKEGEAELCLGQFYTVPEFRKQGVMRHIVEILVKKAWERGCESVHIYTLGQNIKYRKALREMGFRDIIGMKEGGAFVKGDEMEISNNKWHENYHNLQPIRIPAGWSILCNKFEDIEPESISREDDERWSYFDENFKHLFFIRSEMDYSKDGKTETQTLDIALEWDFNSGSNGEFYLQAVLNRNWYEPLLYFSSRSKAEIIQKLEKWLFVEFMPRCFIDENDFWKNHETT